MQVADSSQARRTHRRHRDNPSPRNRFRITVQYVNTDDLPVRRHGELATAGRNADEAGRIARRKGLPELPLSGGQVVAVDAQHGGLRSAEIQESSVRAPLDRPVLRCQPLNGHRLPAVERPHEIRAQRIVDQHSPAVRRWKDREHPLSPIGSNLPVSVSWMYERGICSASDATTRMRRPSGNHLAQ